MTVESSFSLPRRFQTERLLQHDIAPNEQLRRWIKQYQSGSNKRRRQAAMELLVRHNLRLVYQIAGSLRYGTESMDDLFQSGVYGMIRGLGKYKLSLTTPVSTYLAMWIRQAILRDRDNTSRTIYVPVGVQRVWRQIKREAQRREQKGLSLDATAICATLLEKYSPAERIRRCMSPITPEIVQQVLDGATRDASHLELIERDPENGQMRWETPDPSLIDASYEPIVRDQMEFHLESVRYLASWIDRLPNSNRTIFFLRYGLHQYGYVRSLNDVGLMTKPTVTRQTVLNRLRESWRTMYGLGLSSEYTNEKLITTLEVIERLGALIGEQPLIFPAGTA